MNMDSESTRDVVIRAVAGALITLALLIAFLL
jgi:hypothetical protein